MAHLHVVVVVPIVVRRGRVTGQALLHLPLLVTSRTLGVRVEGVPNREAARNAHPAIVRAGQPFALRTIDGGRHVIPHRWWCTARVTDFHGTKRGCHACMGEVLGYLVLSLKPLPRQS